MENGDSLTLRRFYLGEIECLSCQGHVVLFLSFWLAAEGSREPRVAVVEGTLGGEPILIPSWVGEGRDTGALCDTWLLAGSPVQLTPCSRTAIVEEWPLCH